MLGIATKAIICTPSGRLASPSRVVAGNGPKTQRGNAHLDVRPELLAILLGQFVVHALQTHDELFEPAEFRGVIDVRPVRERDHRDAVVRTLLSV